MNNLSSCCGLVDARISASDKDLPVKKTVPQVPELPKSTKQLEELEVITVAPMTVDTTTEMSNCILKILKNCRNKSVHSLIISKINIQ